MIGPRSCRLRFQSARTKKKEIIKWKQKQTSASKIRWNLSISIDQCCDWRLFSLKEAGTREVERVSWAIHDALTMNRLNWRYFLIYNACEVSSCYRSVLRTVSGSVAFAAFVSSLPWNYYIRMFIARVFSRNYDNLIEFDGFICLNSEYVGHASEIRMRSKERWRINKQIWKRNMMRFT